MEFSKPVLDVMKALCNGLKKVREASDRAELLGKDNPAEIAQAKEANSRRFLEYVKTGNVT